MPRLAKSLPKYRHHKASGQAVVVVDVRTHYLGPHGTRFSRAAYDRQIGEYLAGGRALASGTTDLTVTELIARYWRYVVAYHVKHGRRTGEQGAVRCALRPLRTLYGNTPALDFGSLRLEAARARMVDDGFARPTSTRTCGASADVTQVYAERDPALVRKVAAEVGSSAATLVLVVLTAFADTVLTAWLEVERSLE